MTSSWSLFIQLWVQRCLTAILCFTAVNLAASDEQRNALWCVQREKCESMANGKGFETIWVVDGIREGKMPLGLDV